MSIKIKLMQYPNQTFPVTLDSSRYEITIKDVDQCLTIDITKDDAVIIQGCRILPNSLIIPYTYLTDGNFILVTQDEELPDWNQFEITQELFYLTGDEITDI